jgi:DNA-binding NtrC family response regulator
VRELENAIARACILADASTLDLCDLSLPAPRADENASHLPETFAALDLSGSLAEATERAVTFVERRKIAEALSAHDGNKTRAAETLGVSYKTLLTKIKDYEL